MSEAELVHGIESKLLGQVRLVMLGRSLISDGGSFTLVSGYLFDDPIPLGVGFSVANGGVEGFVRAAALSLDRGVRVNAVSPGLAEDSDEEFARLNPGRIPVPMPNIGAAFVRSVEGWRTGETIRAW
jgi:NAD(P)-dependent dehydrogenase (short-subunit alcohol dehydrogenase family)